MTENWITQLPEGWREKQIRYIFGIHNGATPKSGDSEYWNGDINWITPEDLGNNSGKEIAESRRKISAEGYANSGVSLAPAGSIAISTRAPIGHLAVTTLPSCVNQGCRLLEPKEGNSDYWYYASVAAKPILVSRGQGTTFMELPRQSLASVKLPVPPIDEQVAIAHFLDFKTAQIDALIAKKKTLLEKLAEKRTALISHAVTKGLDPSVPMKDSGVEWLGEIPTHWKTTRVKFVACIGNGSTPSREKSEYWVDGYFPWLNSSVVNQEEVTASDQFVTDLALKECHLPVVHPPAVLVGITGQGKTRGMASKLGLIATINQHLAFIKPTASDIRVDYLLFLFERAYSFLRSESDGGGSTKGAITCEQIANLEIPFPPTTEQASIELHIAEELKKLRDMNRRVSTVVEKLQEYRSALITNAVTGKIDVRDFPIPDPVAKELCDA